MPITATLHSDMCWTDMHEREHDLELTYTFDGDSLEVVKIAGGPDIADIEWDCVEEAAFNHCGEICDQAFAEWRAGRDEYLCDQADDRKAA